jgi:hypothetical protein
LAVDVAVVVVEAAEAGAAALVGRYNGPFCPQLASSPKPRSSSGAAR